MITQLISISAIGGVQLLAQWLIVMEIDAITTLFDKGCFRCIAFGIELM